MKKFEVPHHFESSLVAQLKNQPKKINGVRDYSPTSITIGTITFKIAKHFGFCFGVENAVEIAYRTLRENPNKRIYLLSEIIHNPIVNEDLIANGIQFIQKTDGTQLIEWDLIHPEDIVLIPAFGTTVQTKNRLEEKGIPYKLFDTTCPFVELVWKRSQQLSKKNTTTIIHGKPNHEETRATFSNAALHGKALILQNLEEAKLLGEIIMNESKSEFYSSFADRFSSDFKPKEDLLKIGIVNQTTLLAEETQEIADYLKKVMLTKYGEEEIHNHFEDTRDTLCYATNDNQQALKKLLQEDGDFCIIVGGKNSSNTSHLVELSEKALPTFYIQDASNISSDGKIHYYNMSDDKMHLSDILIQKNSNQTILISAGASCPDRILENVIQKIAQIHQIDFEEVKREVDRQIKKGNLL